MAATKPSKQLPEFFKTKELAVLAGLTKEMVDYLCIWNLLQPSVRHAGQRGAQRQFSFSDVLLARSIAKLLHAGVSVKKLRVAVATMKDTLKVDPKSIRMDRRIVIQGKQVLFVDAEQRAIDLTANGQMAFSFVLDVVDTRAQADGVLEKRQKAVKRRLERQTPPRVKRGNFAG